MNYNKVIKDLKEKNDKLQEQYRLRDIRCIHLEYENEKLKAELKLYQGALKREDEAIHRANDLEFENQELKEDISFCLHSIKQEMKMSTDSRTRSEMTSCYEILKRWNK